MLEKCECVLYADDTVITATGKDKDEIKDKLEHDVPILVEWFRANKLTLNADKTELLFFDLLRKRATLDMSVSVNGTLIHETNSVKYLGVWIDKDLSFNTHVNNLCNKLNGCKYMISCTQSLLPSHVLRLVYFAHFQSHLMYCLSVWGGIISKQQLKRLFVLQKKCIRVISHKSYNSHTEPLFKELNILPFEKLLDLQNYKLGFDMMNKHLPLNILKLFNFTDNNRTRNSGMPIIAGHKSAKYNRSFLCQPIMHWNSLSPPFKAISSRSLFIQNMKVLLKSTD